MLIFRPVHAHLPFQYAKSGTFCQQLQAKHWSGGAGGMKLAYSFSTSTGAGGGEVDGAAAGVSRSTLSLMFFDWDEWDEWDSPTGATVSGRPSFFSGLGRLGRIAGAGAVVA